MMAMIIHDSVSLLEYFRCKLLDICFNFKGRPCGQTGQPMSVDSGVGGLQRRALERPHYRLLLFREMMLLLSGLIISSLNNSIKFVIKT